LQRRRFAGKTSTKTVRNTLRDSVFASQEAKKRHLTPVFAQFHSTFGCDFHRISAFRRHRGFEHMKAKRRARAAASKGAAKKAPKRKKAAKRRKAKKK
jgi:hypothetical protein